MKINTEIVQNAFIVTCDGARLDASFAKTFFTSMQGFIKKGHMNIVLDLSKVEFVDSTGLGAIVRCLKEIGGQGQLVLCGVNEMVLSLLQMTHLDSVFIQAKDRNEAMMKLIEAQKKRKLIKKKVVKPAATPPKVTGFDQALLASLSMEDSEEVQDVTSSERRKHRRVMNKQILNEDIVVHCTNTSTGRRTTAVALDISPGGLLLVSPSKLIVGDQFVMEGRIGVNFRFKEYAVIRNTREGKYGFEFIKPSGKTTAFLNQLTGSVVLGSKK